MKPYFKTTTFTTAASALLTILNNLNSEIEATQNKEFEIWQKSATLPTRASSIFALAAYAKKCGLNPTVLVEEKEFSFPDYRFYRYTKEDIDHAKFSEKLFLNQAEENGVEIKESKITLEMVKKHIQDNKTILLRLNTKPIRNEKRNTSNYIIVHGFSAGYFHIIDTAFSALSIPEEVMQEAFHSLETKKYRDHRMIIFEN